MAKVLISSLYKQAVNPFPYGYFSFGALDIANTNTQTFNEVISKATSTRSTRANMITAARICQNAAGFSSTTLYHLKGYTGSTLSTASNKVLCATDTQAIPTLTFTTERRGPYVPLPTYLGLIYYFGGYNDSTGLYSNATTYIKTPVDTVVNTTNITVARHVGAVLKNNSNAWLIGGTTTGGAATNDIYKWTFSTDSIAIITAKDTVSSSQAYAINYTSFGYRSLGNGTSRGSAKFTYATETVATGTAIATGDADALMLAGTQHTTESKGVLWTGYRGSTNFRTYLLLTFATEAWDNQSYTTAINNGWVQSTSGG